MSRVLPPLATRIRSEHDVFPGQPLRVLARVPLMPTALVHECVTGRAPLPADVQSAYLSLVAGLGARNGGFSFPRGIVVIGASGGEGRTTTCVQLALALAGTGREVVLVDADTRNRRVGALFGLRAEEPPLADLVSGYASFRHPLVRAPGHERVRILLADAFDPASPADDATRVRAALAAAVEEADAVIVDSAPLAGEEVLEAARAADAVLVAARLGHTRTDDLTKLSRELTRRGLAASGLVLTTNERAGADDVPSGGHADDADTDRFLRSRRMAALSLREEDLDGRERALQAFREEMYRMEAELTARRQELEAAFAGDGRGDRPVEPVAAAPAPVPTSAESRPVERADARVTAETRVPAAAVPGRPDAAELERRERALAEREAAVIFEETGLRVVPPAAVAAGGEDVWFEAETAGGAAAVGRLPDPAELERRERALAEREAALARRETGLRLVHPAPARSCAPGVAAGTAEPPAETAGPAPAERPEPPADGAEAATPAPAATTEPDAPTPDEQPAPAAPASWNLAHLERLVRRREREFPERVEEWRYHLLFLRRYADVSGTLPPEFDGLVVETFGELVGAA